jgi:2-isopropylmalate synthase
VFDRDLEALINSKKNEIIEHYRLICHNVLSGNQTIATASVQLMDNKNQLLEEASCGDGPVDAVFKAIKKAVDREITLKDYQLKAVTSGQDALGEATVWVEENNLTYSGRGLSTDVIEASAKAYVNALNKIISGNRVAIEAKN